MKTYKIVRFEFAKVFDEPPKTIKTGLTLKQAQNHCKRDDTKGKEWFDGYTKE